MSPPDFSIYLNRVCSGISSKKKRGEISRELYEHLIDNYERNIAIGMSDEEAKKDAEERMGDADTLNYRLSELHSFSPIKSMSSAMNLLIVTYVLFNFIFGNAVRDVFFYISLLPLFIVLLRMRKLEGGFRATFIFYCVFVSMVLMNYALCVSFDISGSVISCFTGVNMILKAVLNVMICHSLKSFSEKYAVEQSKKPHLTASAVYLFFFNLLGGFIFFFSEGENVTINLPVVGWLIPIMFVFTLIQLFRVRAIVWDADGEYGILPMDKSNMKNVGLFLFICVAVVSGSILVNINKKPEKVPFPISDVSQSEIKRVEKTRENMLSLGLPKEVLDDLPDSEILNYENAKFMETVPIPEMADEKAVAYVFRISERSKVTGVFRILIPFKDDDGKKGRGGIYFINNTGILLNNMYFGAVTEKDGEKFLNGPLYKKEYENAYSVKGFDYMREKAPQRMYFALSVSEEMKEEGDLRSMSVFLFCEIVKINPSSTVFAMKPYHVAANYSNTMSKIRFNRKNFSVISRVMYSSLDS